MTALPSPQRLASLCAPATQGIALEIVAETGSTNADLLARAPQLQQATLLWAQRQTAGKGRAGRAWHTPPGSALTFSLAWKFNLPLQGLLGLPLAVGVVIAEALRTFGVEAHLKWPNDILKDEGKLAGILIETVVEKSGPTATWAVIGVGINIAQASALSAQAGRAVVAASELAHEPERVMAALLDGFAQALPVFEQRGFAAFVETWNALDAYAGQAVNILDQGKVLHSGQAAGVDDSGRLLLDTVQGRITIAAGDVSLRIRED
ncbi:biotin--[acetyl-CoA-carboxylase] ligase [Herminiimonas sp. KBW02]|uniref:biotin--[acetyl-CoA-carboxylase] ligase n=1 Tax=Herminiimonas sp. KBW02 TaxID=2153363 RepID=UPI000F597C66|nr:biotin--[acetyl-CoA-carboxylase] ligase [Herminiimonas sp. KBW02]RQO34733.1 biotin--[acetyl-CoA-carboxylase] ligase [Herminiimonas sp. KBW02]